MIKIKTRLLRSRRDRLQGLLHAKKAFPVLIKTRFGIHTFGLGFPIDVLILDSNNKVVKVCENLPPNRIFVWFPIFDTVLELPAGEVKKRRIRAGEVIKLIP